MDEPPAYDDRIMNLLKENDDKLTVDGIARLAGKSYVPTSKALKRLEQDGLVMHEKMGRTHYYRLAEYSAVEMDEFNRLMKTLDDAVENLKKDFPTNPSYMLGFINGKISSIVNQIGLIKDDVNIVTTGKKAQRIEYKKTGRYIASMCRRHIKNPLLLKRLLAYESDSSQVFQEAADRRIKLARKRGSLNVKYRKEIPEHIEKLNCIMDTLVYDACRVKNRLKSSEKAPLDYEDTHSTFTGMLNNLTRRRDMLRDGLESAREWTVSYRKGRPDAVWANKHLSSDFDAAADKLSEMQQGLKDLEGLILTGIKKSAMEERDAELHTVLTEVEKNLQACKRNLREIMDGTE